MAEFDRNKAGLHKNVSSVFKGVPVPQNSGTRQPSDTPAPDRKAEIAPKPASTDHQISQDSMMKKLHQPEESLDKPAPAKQPQSNPFAKATSREATSRSRWPKIKDKLFAPKPGGSTTRQKAMVILVPALAIVMIFMFKRVLSTTPHKTEGATKNAPPIVATADSGNEIDWQIPELLPAVMRDPTKLPGESDAQDNEGQSETIEETAPAIISIKGIVYSEDNPSAFVNGQIVYVGSKVNDATIIRIDRHSVEFERDGKRWEQKIRQ